MNYKKIEEIAKILNECCNEYDEQGNHIRNKCYECEEWSDDNHCCCSYNRKEAEALYNAGYRKQSEGEWIASNIPQEKYVCSVCGGACWYYDCQGEVAKSRYCPNCGAKMKGGAE